MRLNKLKSAVGIWMVGAHFGAIIYVLILAIWYFSFDQTMDVILILTPLFSAFTVAIVADFAKRRTSMAIGPEVNSGFTFVAFLFPTLYTLAIFALITAWPVQWINTIDQLRRGLSICETVIGAAFGIVISALFEAPVTTTQPGSTGTAQE